MKRSGAEMETDSLPTIEKKPPKLRWYQYRLRSLLLFMLLLAICMSWIAVIMQDFRKQKVAAAAIEKAGGSVHFKPTWLGKLLRDDSLERANGVELYGTSVSDANLVHLQSLQQLQSLNLRNTQVSDAGLVHLRRLSQLRELTLELTIVTDAGLVHLEELRQLRYLNLAVTKVTDAGLVHLQGLSQLQKLYLDDTKITDAGVAHLHGLTAR
jgi:hypothetical protein